MKDPISGALTDPTASPSAPEIYRQHADLLLANGSAYRCFCTADELEAARKQQIAAKLPPRYAGTCRVLSAAQIEENLAARKAVRHSYEGADRGLDDLHR